MTEVTGKNCAKPGLALLLAACIALGMAATPASAQSPQPPSDSPASLAEQLYLRLRSIGLDSKRVYDVREAALDYDRLHISLEHGAIAFTEDVYGQVTGAFFEGDGEVLVIPPDQAERASMSLFTGAAILEDRFETAYFRFNDDTFATLQPHLRPLDVSDQFLSKWAGSAKNLAAWDALRLFISFSHCLPLGNTSSDVSKCTISPAERFLHARIQSTKLGIYDLSYDASALEQISIGQQKAQDNTNYYNVWVSFPVNDLQRRRAGHIADDVAIRSYDIDAQVKPPTELQATARVKIDILGQSSRVLPFELSRFLKIKEVKMDGRALEFIQNQALEGTQLARRGNDVVVVVFPENLKPGQKIELRFVYGGDVLSEAGSGLLYVGARGIWYPNRGMAAANFDLRFRYPVGWTLLATGKRVSTTESGESEVAQTGADRTSRWVTETVIPVAGFNLGKYFRAEARAGDVLVETYAAAGVERSFPRPTEQESAPPHIPGPIPQPPQPATVVHTVISPARNAQLVANTAASAVNFYSQRFGPFPYPTLRLTQMPGPLSQGWPGLIFLSSYSFLSPEEKSHLARDPMDVILAGQVTAHETAHQWWGDLVFWRGYRDQWLFEGLANYCSLMMLETQDPVSFQRVMTRYREDLLRRNKVGAVLKDAGPVSLGLRLSSSEFPDGYEAISYGRGTWLFHMLRHMLEDNSEKSGRAAIEQPFLRALHQIRERYAGRPVTTLEVMQMFAEELPSSVRYEDRKKLDWFYEGWVNGTAIPHFELEGIKLTSKERSVSVSGIIVQKNAPKELVTSVPLYARLAGNRRVFVTRIFADGPETAFHIIAPAGTRGLLIDPEQTVLKN